MKILITGGAGFIGVNSAFYFSNEGHEVVIFDNLSRIGSDINLNWIKKECSLEFVKGDIRNFDELRKVVSKKGPFQLILHLAAQVAVTTSVEDPREDFEINALGTFNILEAIRQYNPEAFLIYSSTNKVYGKMDDLDVVEQKGRYEYSNMPNGIAENRNLDFHSPYGCSKGAADQYCIDYTRIYGLKTVVMRQSCIYGYRQFGIEDQGWVAWFCIAALMGKNITIYGDGKQVRDVLFIDDLIKAYELAYEKKDHCNGNVFNIGGGPENTLSLHELIDLLYELEGEKIPLSYDEWRPGDQKVFISNISLAEKQLNWKPEISPGDGVKKLYDWINKNREIFKGVV
ncbi:MAG: NAD-dependent epimerase/dehydratase family protein [Candidatus Aminicenantaceae bacterium]